MKFGRIEVDSPDGPVARLVSVHPDQGRLVDLCKAERLRLQASGATPTAASRAGQATFPGSTTEALSLGAAFLEAAHRADDARADDASLPLESARWLSAADPPMLRDCSAFEDHLVAYHARLGLEMDPLHYELPVFYKTSTATLLGHDDEVPWPYYTEALDYELEVGFVVGRTGHNLSPDQADAHIFGVTIFNDFSARDIQRREMKLLLGPTKSKDLGTALGPWITTADEVDLRALQMTVRINGEEISRGTSEHMIWSPAELLAYISLGDVLRPGDVVGSGTVAGGSGLEQGRQIAPGDVIELDMSGVGTLRNRLGQPERAGWLPEPKQPNAALRAPT